MISVAQHSNQNVRRARRRPAGWLLVEVASGASGRLVSGRLVDTSGGGMGLVLNEGLPEGQLVRVTRGDTSVAAGASSDASSASWEGLEARVAHASPLPTVPPTPAGKHRKLHSNRRRFPKPSSRRWRPRPSLL